jgi:hypothetical protein
MEALLGMDSTPCKDCGEVYVHFDPSVRYHNSGKCMPLMRIISAMILETVLNQGST